MFGISQKKKLENLVSLLSITHYKIREMFSNLFTDQPPTSRLALTMTNLIVINEMIPKSWINPKSRLSNIMRNNAGANSKMLISREIAMRSLNVFSLYQKMIKRGRYSDYLTPYVLSDYEYCYCPWCNIVSEDWPQKLYGHFSERTIDKLNSFIDNNRGFENPLEKYDLLSQFIAFSKWNLTKNIQKIISLNVLDYMNSDLFSIVKNLVDELDIKYKTADPKSLVTIWVDEDWHIDPKHSTNLEYRVPIDQTGFRGIKWNTPLSHFKEEFYFKQEICLNDFFNLSGNNDLLCSIYCRKDNLFYLGNANVDYLYYLFSDDKFVGILTTSKTKQDYANLLTTLQAYLGKADKVVISNSNTIYEWYGNEGQIIYQCLKNIKGYLGMFSKELILVNDLKIKEF